eukprot:Awhi_evm1s8880
MSAEEQKKVVVEEEDDVDLFGSDDEEDVEESEERKRVLAEYHAKKAAKADAGKATIAKSTIKFDVKPWEAETDMEEMEKLIREIEMDGLTWGFAKLEDIGYGIKKLNITCTIEDAKVSSDDLENAITELEDHVQSVDVTAFNKV